jgi:hypothetical protein
MEPSSIEGVFAMLLCGLGGYLVGDLATVWTHDPRGPNQINPLRALIYTVFTLLNGGLGWWFFVSN